MRFFIALIILLAFWFFAGWSLISGITDCIDYFAKDVEFTSGQAAWAIIRIFPLAEILFAIGWLAGGATLFIGGRKSRW